MKLAGQIDAALFPIATGVRIAFLNTPFGDGFLFLADWQSWLLTLDWVVGLTNAVNLIDGLDGLAAGVAFFAALTLTFLSATQGLLSVGAEDGATSKPTAKDGKGSVSDGVSQHTSRHEKDGQSGDTYDRP